METTTELQNNPATTIQRKSISRSESGHEKNVFNLEILNASIAGFGTAYNPAKPSIKALALVTLATTARVMSLS